MTRSYHLPRLLLYFIVFSISFNPEKAFSAEAPRPAYSKALPVLGLVVTYGAASFIYKKLKGNSAKKVTRIGVVSLSGDITDSAYIISQLRKMFEDPTIKAILLKIDSPGGPPGPSQNIYLTIRMLKQIYKKPIIVWVENICASAAYYVACATDYIISTPSALIGSIGIYWQQRHLKKFFEQFQIEHSVLYAGKYKTATNPYVEPSPEGTAMLQNMLDSDYRHFVSDVQNSRQQLKDIPEANWADGRIFSGRDTLGILIDEIGCQINVESKLRELTGATDTMIFVYPGKSSLWQRLFGAISDDEIRMSLSHIIDTFCMKLGVYPQLQAKAAL